MQYTAGQDSDQDHFMRGVMWGRHPQGEDWQ
jgi:hypothetical protein